MSRVLPSVACTYGVKVVTDMFLCEVPVYSLCDSTLAEVGFIVVFISEMPACRTQNQLHGTIFKDFFFEKL